LGDFAFVARDPLQILGRKPGILREQKIGSVGFVEEQIQFVLTNLQFCFLDRDENRVALDHEEDGRPGTLENLRRVICQTESPVLALCVVQICN
jgi:hypothetical protein